MAKSNISVEQITKDVSIAKAKMHRKRYYDLQKAKGLTHKEAKQKWLKTHKNEALVLNTYERSQKNKVQLATDDALALIRAKYLSEENIIRTAKAFKMSKRSAKQFWTGAIKTQVGAESLSDRWDIAVKNALDESRYTAEGKVLIKSERYAQKKLDHNMTKLNAMLTDTQSKVDQFYNQKFTKKGTKRKRIKQLNFNNWGVLKFFITGLNAWYESALEQEILSEQLARDVKTMLANYGRAKMFHDYLYYSGVEIYHQAFWSGENNYYGSDEWTEDAGVAAEGLLTYLEDFTGH